MKFHRTREVKSKGTAQKMGGREPNRALMYQKHMPYSKGPALKLAGREMSTWWSKDGKRPMLNMVHFLMIVNKQREPKARDMWLDLQTTLGQDCKFYNKKEGCYDTDIMDIADILDLLRNEHIPYPPKFKDASRFRDTIIADLTKILTASENADTSIINAAPSAPEDAVPAAASIAQQATNTVMNDTESDSDLHDSEDDDDTGIIDDE